MEAVFYFFLVGVILTVILLIFAANEKEYDPQEPRPEWKAGHNPLGFIDYDSSSN